MILKTVSWIFGLAVFAAGVVNLFWGNDSGFGAFMILLSFVYFPWANALLKKKTGFSIPRTIKIILGIFIIWAALGVGELSDKIDLIRLADDRKNWETEAIEDDFTRSLVAAAVEQTTEKVVYDPDYYQIDYPNGDIPSDRGVCTDVIIRAYRKSGIDLQKEVHEDMAENFGLYPDKWGLTGTDTNIDHRRVPNLQVFFKRFGKELEISKSPESYHPGDIVTWNMPSGRPHIGLVSNFNKDGVPLVIHNIGAGPKIDNALFAFEISGHYRYLCK